ncbi:conserved hypothetical protein [Ricinus communis]|uniref:Uncharacterized protein n=1 Tax=Ricinus communis TaxID=3988 RepID=B9RMU9_RICCO|nr:conserved hypothetical protein [Ricinus communis]
MTLDWCLRDKGGKHPNTVKRRMTTNEETIEHVNMDTNDSIPEEYTTGIDSIREEYAAGVEHEVFNDEPKGTSSTFAALSPIIPSPQTKSIQATSTTVTQPTPPDVRKQQPKGNK